MSYSQSRFIAPGACRETPSRGEVLRHQAIPVVFFALTRAKKTTPASFFPAVTAIRRFSDRIPGLALRAVGAARRGAPLIFLFLCLCGPWRWGGRDPVSAGETAVKVVVDGVSYSIPAPRIGQAPLALESREAALLRYSQPFPGKISRCEVILDVSGIDGRLRKTVGDFGEFCGIKYAFSSLAVNAETSGAVGGATATVAVIENRDAIIISLSQRHEKGAAFRIYAVTLAADRPVLLLLAVGVTERQYEKAMLECANRWIADVARLNAPIARTVKAVRNRTIIEVPLPTGYERYIPGADEGGYGSFFSFDAPANLSGGVYPSLALALDPLIEHKIVNPLEFRDWKYLFKRDAVDAMEAAEIVDEGDKHLLYRTRLETGSERHGLVIFVKSRGLLMIMDRDPKASPRVDPVKILHGWRRDIYRLNREKM